MVEEPPKIFTFPKFHSNQRVLFKAIERTGGVKEVKGRVIAFKEGQLRRTDNGMYWYRVKYTDTSFPGDPTYQVRARGVRLDTRRSRTGDDTRRSRTGDAPMGLHSARSW